VRPSGEIWKKAGLLSSIAFVFPFSIAVGYFAGRWFDRKFDTEPWLSLVGLGLGTVAAFVEVFRIVAAVDRMSERRKEGNEG
jgi:F0F1-type ATP synthase assembly protein I